MHEAEAANGNAVRRVPRRALLVVLAGLTLGYSLGIALLPAQSTAIHAWADLGWLVMTAWGAVECWRARGAEPIHRLACLMLAAACLAWMLAMLVWLYLEIIVGRLAPFPTVADLGFIGFAPLYALGLSLLSGGARTVSLSLRHVADLGLALGTMLYCSVVIYYRPSVESGLPLTHLATALAYPVAYLSAMVFGLLAFFQQAAGLRRRTLALHLGALSLVALAYTLYGVEIMTRSYQSGHLLDPLWFAGLALTVWAAREDQWAPQRVRVDRPVAAPTTLDAVLPALAFALLAVVTIAFRDDLAHVPLVLLAGTAMLLTVSLALRGLAVLRLERELRRELQRRARELHRAQKMEAIGALAGGLAHDFNNLLTGIMTGASMLRRDRPEQSRAELLDMVEQSALRASEITRRLLALSHRRRTSAMGVVDVARIVRRADALLRGAIAPSIQLVTGTVAPGLRVWGDEGELEQVLLNLGLNAVHAMPHGGTLELSVAREPRLHGGKARSAIVIRVRDEGSGIPESDRARIFEPFFTTRQPGEGTGLGLAMVYSTVEAHDGTIQFESTVGRGTTFELALPETDREGPASAATGEPDWLPQARAKETVLVIDDRDAPLLAAKVILEGCGYQVLLATRGSEALKTWRQHPTITLVLTDSRMPEMQGSDLLVELRAEGFTGPAILMTGYEEERDGLPPGFAATLEKPFGAAPLAQVVRRVLDDAAGTRKATG